MICNSTYTFTLFWADIKKMSGCYAGFMIPYGRTEYNEYLGKEYFWGGATNVHSDYVGFRPIGRPTHNDWLNGGNVWNYYEYNSIMQNYEDTAYYDGSNSVHDFKYSSEIKLAEIDMTKSSYKSRIGKLIFRMNDGNISPELKTRLLQEMKDIESEKLTAPRYYILKIDYTQKNGTIKTRYVFASIDVYEQNTSKKDGILTMDLFDTEDLFVQANVTEESKNQDDKGTREYYDLLGGMPRKDNVYFEYERFFGIMQDLRNQGEFGNIANNEFIKMQNAILDIFVRGSDDDQASFLSYGWGKKGIERWWNKSGRLLPPNVSKDDDSQIRSWRMQGNEKNIFASYVVYHLREAFQMNTVQVNRANGEHWIFEDDNFHALESTWVQSGRDFDKSYGIGTFLFNSKNLDYNETRPNYHYINTSANSFGEGLIDLLRQTGKRTIDIVLTIEEVDGLQRAVLTPDFSTKTFNFEPKDIKDGKVKRTFDRNKAVHIAGAYRMKRATSDGNSNYQNVVNPNFERDKSIYNNIGIHPYNPNVTSMSIPEGKTFTNNPRYGQWGVDNQKGWAKEWNDESYLQEVFHPSLDNNNYDGGGGFVRRNQTETNDKKRNEAKQFVENIPRASKVNIELELSPSAFEDDKLPFFDINPYDRIKIVGNYCGQDYDFLTTVDSVNLKISTNGKVELGVSF